MPLKSKRSVVNHQSRSAGFLRPTMASQRRSLNFTAESTTKAANKKRGSKPSKHRYVKESMCKSPEKDVKSAVELYRSTTSGSSCSRSFELNSPVTQSVHKYSENSALADAKKMCANLQQQINELKVNQENINRSMVRSDNYNHVVPTQCLDKPADVPLNAAELHHSIPNSVHPNSVIRVNIQKNSQPLFDASNRENELPNVQAYQSTFRKKNNSESVIKKLHSERDKYKHKVLKLQTELKLVKRGKEKIMKSPELSQNDITYYNTNLIGEGYLATVYSGTYKGKQVAVKKISKLGMLTSSDFSYLSAEAGLLIHLHHRNIVKIHGVCLSSMEPLIVMELVHGKTLLDVLNNAGEHVN